jgi:Na+/pantothenate symporter
VFSLVLIAWSTLASAFGPLMLVYAMHQKPKESLALAMMIVGVATVLLWRHFGLDQSVVYEVMPGMLSGLAVFVAGKMAGLTVAPERARRPLPRLREERSEPRP